MKDEGEGLPRRPSRTGRQARSGWGCRRLPRAASRPFQFWSPSAAKNSNQLRKTIEASFHFDFRVDLPSKNIKLRPPRAASCPFLFWSPSAGGKKINCVNPTTRHFISILVSICSRKIFNCVSPSKRHAHLNFGVEQFDTKIFS